MRSVKRKLNGSTVNSALQQDNGRKMERDVREGTGCKNRSVQEWLITFVLYSKILFRMRLTGITQNNLPVGSKRF
jgi:hypothetical protein